jgi:hypothetical protein
VISEQERAALALKWDVIERLKQIYAAGAAKLANDQ